MRFRFKRPSPAMAVALTSLVVSLSGTAVAAQGLITGAQIKDHSVGLVDMSNMAITKLRGQQGPAGPTGPPGAQGAQGAPGPAGAFDPNKVSVVAGGDASIASYNVGTSTAACPTATRVIGGGFSGTADAFINAPVGNGAWTVSGSTTLSGGAHIRAYAICAAP